jgi:hypothetical protein
MVAEDCTDMGIRSQRFSAQPAGGDPGYVGGDGFQTSQRFLAVAHARQCLGCAYLVPDDGCFWTRASREPFPLREEFERLSRLVPQHLHVTLRLESEHQSQVVAALVSQPN